MHETYWHQNCIFMSENIGVRSAANQLCRLDCLVIVAWKSKIIFEILKNALTIFLLLGYQNIVNIKLEFNATLNSVSKNENSSLDNVTMKRILFFFY